MKGWNKKLQVLLVVILPFQILSLNAEKPYILNMSRDTYHAANKNWSIGQDERGYMYFGNDIGLLEFDGVDWQLNQLPNHITARSVAVLSHNTIFTGGFEEFGRWDRDLSGNLIYTSLTGQFDKSLLKNDEFWKIWITEDIVYFQSFNSIFTYDFQQVKKLDIQMGLLFLSRVRDEFLVQQMVGPVFKLENNSFIPIEGSAIFHDTDVRVILPYGKDQYLIGTSNKGIYIYNGESFSIWNEKISELMITNELNCGILTTKGSYYLGTILGGIYEISSSGEILNHISSENYLQNNTVLALYEDQQENIWAALDRGISYIQYIPNISSYTDPSGKTGAVYDATLWNNILFLGTNQGIFYISENRLNSTNIFKEMKLLEGTQGQVWQLVILDNKLYYCHNKGIKEILPSLKVENAFSIPIGVTDFTQVSLHNRPVYLFSTYNSVVLLDKENRKEFILDEIREPIQKAFTDHLNNLWLEHTNKGVFRCQINDDLSSLKNSTYYGGEKDDTLPFNLKLFKVGGRIVLFGDDTFYTYDDIEDKVVTNDLLNKCFDKIRNIRQIKQINKDTFWALTETAIFKFHYDGYEALITENYNLGTKFSLVHNFENIAIINDTLQILCLDNGFLWYTADRFPVQRSINLSTPYFESLKISNMYGEEQYKDLNEQTSIPYPFNSVNFGFSANNFYTSDLSFQCMLTHVDQEWSAPFKNNTISYARLPKGEYQFLLRSVDYLGNYSGIISYSFKILPPWYESGWAYLCYIVLISLSLYSIWLLILRRYRNLHLQKIRLRETKRLRTLAGELQNEVDRKSAELLTQTSYIIQKNEVIQKMKDLIEEYYIKNRTHTSTVFYQKINNHLSNNSNSEEDWKMFLIKFEEKHTHFFKEMKMLYPDLTSNDLRLCACLKLNLETKEIASLMNLSIKAVENNRYRLRKKLNLKRDQNLNDFFLNF